MTKEEIRKKALEEMSCLASDGVTALVGNTGSIDTTKKETALDSKLSNFS